jgi:receptor protein-tyrosine kinase
MSRNYELMQKFENSTASEARRHPPGSLFASAKKAVRETETEDLSTDEALQLVQRVFLQQAGDPPHVVVFAGINHGDGCSRISVAVAETLVKNVRGSVCLVEANFRTPSLPDMFGTTNHFGLTNAILSDDPIRTYAKPVRKAANLWLLSSGALKSNSASLLSSERLKERLKELRSEFEFVIIDAPPLTRYGDAMAIGQLTDGIVLILEAGATRREAAQAVTADLRTSKIPILGAVLNKRTFPIPEHIYKRL